MKFKRHTKLEHGLQQIDIAPLIDVVFLLIIFFMLTSPLTSPSGIYVKLPKAITSDIVKEKNFIVTITSEDILYFNGVILTTKELRGELSRMAQKDSPILIKSDRRASVGRIVEVWDLCRELGIEKINIATNQEK